MQGRHQLGDGQPGRLGAGESREGPGARVGGKPDKRQVQDFLHKYEKEGGIPKCPCRANCEEEKAGVSLTFDVNKAQCKGALDWVLNSANLATWTKAPSWPSPSC